MIRWNLIFTRVFILLLILVAVWISRDALIRQYLIRSAESKIGAKVEIGQVYTSLTDNKIFIKQLEIADPRDPMKNFFQSAATVLEFNREKLLRREFVIEHGSASQLVFGSPRTNSGAINSLKQTDEPADSKNEIEIRLAKQNPEEAWLDHFNVSGKPLKIDSLNLTQTAKQVFQKLNSDLNQQLQQLTQLKSTIVEIRKAVNELDSNVLRADKLNEAEKRLQLANEEIERTVRRMTELDLQLATDKIALQQAKKADQQRLSAHTDSSFVDADILNRVLLNEEQILQARQVLDWYISFKNAVPDPNLHFQSRKRKGTNVQLPFRPALPDFWIKSLDLDGEGRISGNKFNFTGHVTNLSTDPELNSEPTQFQLRAQGHSHVVVDCTIDRTGAVPSDTIHVICSDIPIPAKILGNKQMMQMAVSPSRSQIDITLTRSGDELTGDLKFEFENLVTQIEHLDELAGGANVAERVNLELGNISNYSISAKISGTLNEPVIDFQSSLGTQLTQTVNQVLGHQQETTQTQLDKMLNEYFVQLDQFSGRIHKANEILETEIVNEQTRIASELKNRTNGFSTNRSLRR